MDYNNILNYLDLFAQDLAYQHGYNIYQFKVLVVGGAALALKYAFRGTVDIDADISFGGAISRSIRNVAKKAKVPTDWLNQDFVKSPSYSRRIWDDSIFCQTLQNYIAVYVVSDITQACMKIVSGRQKDYQDLELLCGRLKVCGCTYDRLLQHYRYLYGDMVKPNQKALRFVKVALNSRR